MFYFQASYNGPYTIQTSGINHVFSGQAGEQYVYNDSVKEEGKSEIEENQELEVRYNSSRQKRP